MFTVFLPVLVISISLFDIPTSSHGDRGIGVQESSTVVGMRDILYVE